MRMFRAGCVPIPEAKSTAVLNKKQPFIGRMYGKLLWNVHSVNLKGPLGGKRRNSLEKEVSLGFHKSQKMS